MLLLPLQKIKVGIVDPSDKFRPEKDEAEFRNFGEDSEFIDRVRRTYQDMHTNQTVQYVRDRVSSAHFGIPK